ncbi:Fatty acid hydroxylase superfamily [Musa troglodytarum]|uniref:beta-carotene 3-hydroxylase n=1 Tax=Musa troglodytarum TaxID=320322 RepID=A0A9E7EX63_9LILI|nr:Fatty acid hydroxylase superfamily [Musa troglodytarum]
MAAGISAAATTLISCCFPREPSLPPKAAGDCLLLFGSSPGRASAFRLWRRRATAVCFVLKEVGKDAEKNSRYTSTEVDPQGEETERSDALRASSERRTAERTARKQSERRAYLIAAVLSSLGITSTAVAAVYYRFSWQMEGGEVPLTEMFGTFALSVGAAVGMEFWARWAHRALWHASLWNMHESHHRPRDGPFELNDVFAIINAVPAISLMAYGFLNRGLLPGLCFGAVSLSSSPPLPGSPGLVSSHFLHHLRLTRALRGQNLQGLGITLFGMAYMFVHDGLVHRRFPVGPIANVPYFRRVAAAHQIHHMDKFDGVPYGLFLGPKELEEVGGLEELEKEISRRAKLYNSSGLRS